MDQPPQTVSTTDTPNTIKDFQSALSMLTDRINSSISELVIADTESTKQLEFRINSLSIQMSKLKSAYEAFELSNNPRPLPNPLHKGGGQPDTQPTTPVPTSPDPLWSHPDIQSIMDKELVKGIAGEIAPGIISLETKDYKGKTATELLDQGKYDTVENYPKQYDRPEDKITTDSLEITFLNPTKSRKTADIKAEMHRLGVRPLNAHELYALGIKYPELQRKQALIALGSAQTFGGDIRFPYLWGNGSRRRVDASTGGGGWNDGCRFPVVRK